MSIVENKPLILLDADETLWHTLDSLPKSTKESTLKQISDMGLEVLDFYLPDFFSYGGCVPHYRTVVRPYAIEFINNVKLLGYSVKILTAATQDYAEEIVKLGGYGIDKYDIISRDDGYHNNKLGGRFESVPRILIDDLPETHKNTQKKLKFLGDNTTLLNISSFNPETFSKNVSENPFKSIFEIITA